MQQTNGNKNSVKLSVLRLDKIHPVVSGNKLFKLQYFLEEAKNSLINTIVTFGGAYSNHLAATAFACKTEGITCIGIVRGEEPTSLIIIHYHFAGIMECRLEFISRSSYRNINDHAFRNSLI